MNHSSKSPGFTLLEVLLVIGLISILFTVLVLVINPDFQLARARDQVRKNDVLAMDGALGQYYLRNNYNLSPLTIDATPREVCDTGTESLGSPTDCTDLVDLRALVPIYMPRVPKDPLLEGQEGTGYQVYINPTNGLVAIEAINPETEDFIDVNSFFNNL